MILLTFYQVMLIKSMALVIFAVLHFPWNNCDLTLTLQTNETFTFLNVFIIFVI